MPLPFLTASHGVAYSKMKTEMQAFPSLSTAQTHWLETPGLALLEHARLILLREE